MQVRPVSRRRVSLCLMPRIAFEHLPDEARLWIFSAERPLSEVEQAQLLTIVDRFIDQSRHLYAMLN